LFNAGVLRQALGDNKSALAHYEQYAKRYRRSKKDAAEVAFRVAVVYAAAGDDGRAEKAYNNYLQTHRDGRHRIEAMAHAGRSAYKLGQYGRAEKHLAEALNAYKRLAGDAVEQNRKFAAEARYYQGELLYRKYDK